MSVFEHQRHRIFNPAQHPLVHDIGALGYANGALPGVSLLVDAVDYIVSHLFPKYIGTYADMAALLAAVPAPAANDYAVISDDGDGKSAGYVYLSLDGTAAWMKRYDVDWSVEGILAETVNRTAYMYVQKYGMTDKDASGSAIVGTFAGQQIYGGDATNQNLTLNANAADTTGFIQTTNTLRPTASGTLDLGTAALKWKDAYLSGTVNVGTLALAAGSVSDSSGTISFGATNLTTTGEVKAATAKFSSSLEVGPFAGNALVLAAGSITDESGAISFNNENLSTTGTLASGALTVSADMVISAGSITSVSGAISFSDENLSTTGTLNVGAVTSTQLNADNLRLDGNTLSATNVGGGIVLVGNGAGVVDVQSAMTTIGQTVTGTLSVTGQLNADNLRLDGNVLSTTNANGDLTVTPNGSGTVVFSSIIKPGADNTIALGTAAARWSNLVMGGSIGDGTNTITIANLLTFRAVGAPNVGDALFWDGSKWVASAPDTEITHSTVSGLTTGDAGHTQFVMLAGRAGGQTVQGGTASGEHLLLESTAHVTKGFIKAKDTLVPNTDASFSATWSGTDLGGTANYWRHLYSKGEHKGLRLENFTAATLPAASASAVGRLVYTTDTKKIYVDIGGTFQIASGGGGGGGALAWIEDADSPEPITENHDRVYSFLAGETQQVYALIRVPASYGAGSPIKVLLTTLSPDSSGTVLISAQATLIRPGTDLITSTTNQRTTSNTAATQSGATANKPQALTLDISDSTGQINAVAVSAGDLIRVRLYRGTDTATSNVKVPVYGAEVTFS
jgi:hypothetical protein